MFGALKTGVQTIATGKVGASLGATSPYLPGAVTRIGRFLYISSAGWIVVCWYTGYVNERTQAGSGPTLIIPGSGKKKIGSPDRPNPTASFTTLQAGNVSGGHHSSDRSNRSTKKGGSGGPFGVGAVGSRLDQGFDLTSNYFGAPDQCKIIYASDHVPGWANGGLVAGILLTGPKRGKVFYYAEGLIPTVKVGDVIGQFQSIAKPAKNPYNGIVGNIECGWANPSSPTQPLAQISSNKPAVAWDWYNYIRSLGAPQASQTGNAGYP